MRGENPRSNDRKEIEIKRETFFSISISISFFRAEREKLFKSGGGMEPDRSKQQQQQHTTARHRKLLLSNRMNENLCVCYVLNNFFISSFERNPFFILYHTGRIFFLFQTFYFFFLQVYGRARLFYLYGYLMWTLCQEPQLVDLGPLVSTCCCYYPLYAV